MMLWGGDCTCRVLRVLVDTVDRLEVEVGIDPGVVAVPPLRVQVSAGVGPAGETGSG